MAFELSVDLHAVKKLARNLEKSEERIRLAARAADLSFWAWDLKQDQVWLDYAGEPRTGLIPGRELLSHRRYLEIIHPKDRGRVEQLLDRSIQDNHNFVAEFRITGPDKQERWIAAIGDVERDPQGEVSGMRGISIDITTRKQLELEFQKQHNALCHHQRVGALGELSAALAHELSQPLGSILRNAEAAELLLHQDPPNLDELREVVQDIEQDDLRAAGVIERMSALLRRGELRFETIALDGLVDEAVQLLSSEARLRDVAVHSTIPATLPEVRGDRVHVLQVVQNLLQNGLDALEEKQNGVRRIDIVASESAGGLVELAVKDSGSGIDPDNIGDLFELFFTTKSEGGGIGLAISKTIIEAHGGQIWAENHPDGGACVRFTLPVA